jgi:site-specific DNA-methyltransferase (adenine-specific)
MPISEVYNIDCMDFMATCKDKQFDLAIVDPPYGIDTNYHERLINKTGGKYGNAAAPNKNYHVSKHLNNAKIDSLYFEQLFRVSKNQIIWGGNYFIEYLKNTPCLVVWDKNKATSNYADCEIAWTSFDSVAKLYKFTWDGMIQGDMKNKEERIHPTQKPVALYKWLLKNYAKEGDKILDTHLGSQSSRIATYDGGFDFWGCELDLEYFNAGCKRFEQFKSQLKLF